MPTFGWFGYSDRGDRAVKIVAVKYPAVLKGSTAWYKLVTKERRNLV